MLKKLIWLIKHQKEIEELLAKKSKSAQFSIAGVPEYQKKHIQQILESEK